MNPCLCLNSGINRGQPWVSSIIFISLSGLRCWQCSLPSCPHMPSFYLLPVKDSSQNKYHTSFRALGLSFPGAVHPDLSLNSGGAGRGSTAQSGCCRNTLLWIRLQVQLWQETVYPPTHLPATQPCNNYWLDCELALLLHQAWWFFF